MSRYRLELATEADDADLRYVLRHTPMDGHICVSFQREPSFFDAAVVDGTFRQVIVARDCEAGRVIAFGTRSIRARWLDRRSAPVGYLSGLRVLGDHRGRSVITRGYAFLRTLHADGRTPIYLTTIAAGNDVAINILTSGRTGLPAYHYIGDYHTLAIPLTGRPAHWPRWRARSDPQVRPATADDMPQIIAFLQENGPTRQFFPDYEPGELFTRGRTFHGLQPSDLMLAFRSGRLVGTLGAWDQHEFRQSVVHRYSRCLQRARPLYNVWAQLRGLPRLPATGQPLRYLTATLPVVAGDDEDVLRALLNAVQRHAAGGASRHLLLGLHARDPLLKSARRFQTTRYTTRLFLVCWPEGERVRSQLGNRPPYLELGSL
jgi:hypothetical protein